MTNCRLLFFIVSFQIAYLWGHKAWKSQPQKQRPVNLGDKSETTQNQNQHSPHVYWILILTQIKKVWRKKWQSLKVCLWFYESGGISAQYLVPVDVSSVPLCERLVCQRWHWDLTLSLLFLQDQPLSQSHKSLRRRILLSPGLLLTNNVPQPQIKCRTVLSLGEPASRWMTSSSCGQRKCYYWRLRTVPEGQMFFLLSSQSC